MNNNTKNAQKDLPKLHIFVDKLLNLTNDIFANNPIKYKEEDHFGFMVLCFCSKQFDHLKSIKILVQSNFGKDACLIARSMLEGMCLLFWAKNDPEKALLWRGYAWVEDYKTMLKKETNGETVEKGQKIKIINWFNSNGRKYHSKQALRCLKKNKNLPKDPYRNQWYPIPISRIFEEVKAVALHKNNYNYSSKWIHWSPGGFDNLKRIPNNVLSYSNKHFDDSATALASGFQALIQSLEVLEFHLGLGYKQRIESLKDRYINELKNGKLGA